jgi:hypothetical protein
MSQDVRKLRCRIAQVPLYFATNWPMPYIIKNLLKYNMHFQWYLSDAHARFNVRGASCRQEIMVLFNVYSGSKAEPNGGRGNLCNPTSEFSDILWHPTKIYGHKVFLLTKTKPEYYDILYNLTHFPGPLVCRIRQVLLYIIC